MESCRKVMKERILRDVLNGVQDSTGGGWRVLVLDEFTTRVMSSTLKMSDILDCNISVVEDLAKAREPLTQAGIYFIQPTASSVARLCADFSRAPLYPSVHIFFSSKLPAEALEKIKATDALLRVVKTLKEVNMEFLTVDNRTMITDHSDAMVTLMGEHCETDRGSVVREVDVITTRLTTLFATLNDFPTIRYKATRTPEPGDPPGQAVRGSLPQLVSARLIEKLSTLQRGGQLPARETCDLIVLDRSYDAVAPFIHEWSYEAMVYDLVHMEGSVYHYSVENAAGKTEEKQVTLDEGTDDLWHELRHAFIADVYTTLAQRFKEFASKNKAAKLGGGNKGDMSSTNIRALITALPQFREVLSKMGVHIQLSSDLKAVTNERHLTDVGELEQDLVLGEKTSKELITFLQDAPGLDVADKMRLMLCYLATHPGKLDTTKKIQWAKVAGFTSEDMAAVCNLQYLGVRVTEQAAAPEDKKSGFFSKKAKPPKLTRTKREEEGVEQYALNRFNPLLLDVLEDLVTGKLSQEEYPYIRPPQVDPESAAQAASARTARSGLNWARKNQEGGSAGPGARRLIVFIVGGATHGEMRVVHRMAQQSGRDVILGSTSIETPASFTDKLYQMSGIE